MKFIHYLEKISGVSIYGLSSFLIFRVILFADAYPGHSKRIKK